MKKRSTLASNTSSFNSCLRLSAFKLNLGRRGGGCSIGWISVNRAMSCPSLEGLRDWHTLTKLTLVTPRSGFFWGLHPKSKYQSMCTIRLNLDGWMARTNTRLYQVTPGMEIRDTAKRLKKKKAEPKT